MPEFFGQELGLNIMADADDPEDRPAVIQQPAVRTGYPLRAQMDALLIIGETLHVGRKIGPPRA